MDKTIVVNKQIDRYDVYIGRGSLFGNPFRVVIDGTREEVIALYRTWFMQRLAQPKFEQAVERLRGKRLGCFCKPLACHGDVIVEYLETFQTPMEKRRKIMRIVKSVDVVLTNESVRSIKVEELFVTLLSDEADRIVIERKIFDRIRLAANEFEFGEGKGR